MVTARAHGGVIWRRLLSPSQVGPRADSWTREVERCTGVTNAVFGEADARPVLAERAPPLTGRGREGEIVGIRLNRRDRQTVRALAGRLLINARCDFSGFVQLFV